ncbi:MAG: PhzF family phenazine biosynthesis protein [Gemmatimonadota bacterium]|nr:PhzF family phenazine biosynthesis protein [Gemmatimonadota bacterium]
MKYRFYILDVFTRTAFGGNQLAVLPDARGLSADGMRKVAREFNFSETTFVFPSADDSATARVRIFTPAAEVDFAGHPTVGTACALRYGGHTDSDLIILIENMGRIPVRISNVDGVLYGTLTSDAPLDYVAKGPSTASLAEVLSLERDDVLDGFFAGVGLDFCFAHLATIEAVDRATVDKQAWGRLLSDTRSSDIFFFAGELKSGAEIYARMSAPSHGIEEDPATGSAVAALVGVAGLRSGIQSGVLELSVTQGVKMGRPSRMDSASRLRDGKVVSVDVGGPAVLTATGEIEVGDEWLLAER